MASRSAAVPRLTREVPATEGMDAGVVAYSREPRRVELREQPRRPLAAINKVVGEIVDEDPDRRSQSSAGREHKMKGNFLRAPTAESQIRMASRSAAVPRLTREVPATEGMDAGVVAYSREPRRVELREQPRRPLAAINKVVGEIVDEDPDRRSQSSAGREHKMKGNFLRAPTAESQIRMASRSAAVPRLTREVPATEGMDAGVVAYSREPRRVELREQPRRPLAAINKVVGEIVDEDPDRRSQSSAGREHKMKGNFLRAPTAESQIRMASRSAAVPRLTREVPATEGMDAGVVA